MTAVILRDMHPTCFIDKRTGQPDGFGVELLNALATKLNLAVTYVEAGDWSEVESVLQSGRADLCPVMSVIDKRKEFLHFTDTVEAFGITINVRAQSADIRSLTDLKGHSVAVISASLAYDLLKDNKEIRLLTYDSFQTALLDLMAGHVDAFVAPSSIVLKIAQNAGIDDNIRVLLPPLKEGKRSIAVRKEKGPLFQRLQAAVPGFVASAEYQQIYAKWFGKPKPYWTPTRVAVAAGAAFLAAILLMGAWRYVTVVRLNRRLTRVVAELKQAEAALVREKQFAEALFDSLPGTAYVFGEDGRFVRWNHHYGTLFGWTPEQMAQMTALESIAPRDRERVARVIQDIFRDGQGDTELLGLTADGREVPEYCSGVVLEVEGTRYIVGVGLDLTERKRVEEALRESELFLQQTQRIARLGGWKVNPRTDYLAWTDGVYEILEAPRDYRPGLAEGLKFYLPEYIPILQEKLTRCLDTGEPFVVEAEVVTETGKRLWAEVRGLVQIVEGGSPYVVGTFQDITERKRAERELAKTRGLLEAAVEQCSAGILIADAPDVTIRLANAASLAVRGPVSESLIDIDMEQHTERWQVFRPDGSVFPPDELPLSRAVRDGEVSRNVEALIRRAGSEDRWVLANAAPVRDASGAIAAGVVVFSDVTELKRQEMELRQKNEELERFTYTVSHDLKSPLVTIDAFLGYLDQDIKASDGERIERDLNHMRNAARKMGRLLEELLELSRIGRKVSPPEDVSLQDLAREATELVAGRITQRGVTVKVTDKPFVLRGDRLRLLEVFQNLIDNAVKFMGDQASPVVEIGWEEQDGRPVLFVRDNGMGIDPRFSHKLFQIFEKLHPEIEGTGMGLAMVKRIVEVHGGRIWADSQGLGRGATIWFTLGTIPATCGSKE